MFSGTAALAKEKAALLFIPLDNRPVCFSYPVNVMEAAGYKIYTPPEKQNVAAPTAAADARRMMRSKRAGISIKK